VVVNKSMIAKGGVLDRAKDAASGLLGGGA